VLYNIEDIRECLEQLTEDEEEIDNQSTDAKDIWDIKRDIRIFFKREKLAKPSYMSFGYAATLFNYKVGRVLGRGAYGKVNLAFHKLTKKLCAVKSINKSFIKQMSAMMKLENEIFLLRYLRHPSIIKMFEAVDTTEKPPKGSSKTKEALEEKNLNYHLFFMELCQGGDLLHYVRRRKTLDESTAKYIMYELLKGVGYIHSRRICHRDIKLENILLDNLGRIKLCDFGISKLCKEDEDPDNPKDLPMTQACGTPVYMAPEVIRCDEKFMEREKRGKFKEKDPMKKEERKEEEGEEGYEFECDIWSCGIVLYALLYGDFPFKGVGVRDIKLAVLDGTLSLKKSISP
jgi:serine/threonine protein kinase